MKPFNFYPYTEDMEDYEKSKDTSFCNQFKILYSAYLKGTDKFRYNYGKYDPKKKLGHIEHFVLFYNLFMKLSISANLYDHIKKFYESNENEIKSNFPKTNLEKFKKEFVQGYANYFIYFSDYIRRIRNTAAYSLDINSSVCINIFKPACNELLELFDFLKNEKLDINNDYINENTFGFYIKDYEKYFIKIEKLATPPKHPTYHKTPMFNEYFKRVHEL